MPLLLPLPYPIAVEILDLISSECSAKELIIAVQEGSEALRGRLQDEGDESDEQAEEAANEKKHISIAAQSIRLLKICSRGECVASR